MMKYLKTMLLTLSALLCLQACNQEQTPTVTVGIIEPLEHKAMDEIVAGFTETMQQSYPKPVLIKVENAQNDANLQRAIIQKMRDAKYSVIAPIGIDATQMSLSMVHTQPVVGMASDITDQDRKHMKSCNATAVLDQVPANKLMAFIHYAYPDIKQLTLIHSSANKVFPEVKATIEAGKSNGIQVKPIMVTTLPELVGAVQALPASSQGILVLKDHLIVSGVSTLAKTAALRHIPLISSDEGSAIGGAGIAIGVRERDIGIAGAKLAIEILNGTPVCDVPITQMSKLTVFINQQALEKSEQSVKLIVNAADKFNYNTAFVGIVT